MPRSTRDTLRTLRSLALEQGGYFTAKQAKRIGYDNPHLEYHVSVGNFERVEHGLYRLPTVPQGEHDSFIRLTLWSRNRNDVPQAVVSHESALVLHELTELLPDRIHLSVPPQFRKSALRGCVLHKAILCAEHIEERSGFRLTTPLRTLLDTAAGEVSQEQLDKALKEALSLGLVRRTTLVDALRSDPRLERLRVALGEHKTAAR
jgi:predicted transcriptional regulator of viral defense system